MIRAEVKKRNGPSGTGLGHCHSDPTHASHKGRAVNITKVGREPRRKDDFGLDDERRLAASAL